MIEISKAEQIAIAENQLRAVKQSIYDAVITKRVADKVSDKQMSDNAVQRLEKLEKMKDELEIIIDEINKIKE